MKFVYQTVALVVRMTEDFERHNIITVNKLEFQNVEAMEWAIREALVDHPLNGQKEPDWYRCMYSTIETIEGSLTKQQVAERTWQWAQN